MFDPLRKKKRQIVNTHPVTGQKRIIESIEEDNYFENGAINSSEIQTVEPLKCGCITQAAGQCSECYGLVCQRHLNHCSSCHKPLCGEHHYDVKVSEYGTMPMCKYCREAYKRNTLHRKVTRFLLSPFIDFED